MFRRTELVVLQTSGTVMIKFVQYTPIEIKEGEGCGGIRSVIYETDVRPHDSVVEWTRHWVKTGHVPAEAKREIKTKGRVS